MRPVGYERPADVRSAVGVLSRPGARALAGGTNLVDLMKVGVEAPEVLVDVNGLGLDAVEALPDGGLRIGAGVRNSDLAADVLVRTRYPVLARALLSGASGQLRNMASVGGNLLQRTRCPYFMDATKPCNKREPGTGCPARTGISRGLAVLGASEHCIATHPGDMAVALTALGAVVRFEGPDGPGELPMPGFHRLPGDAPQRDTELPPGAVITAVDVPGLPYGPVSTYRKARERASFAFALVSVAAALDVADGQVRDVRLALGSVAHAPWRARRAEEALRGRSATAASFREAADAELEGAEPTTDNAYKVPLARRLLVGTLLELAGSGR
ncbi:FAD binding domain-containing protein [Vallicoccus soli]|uniref:Xanthine dehydrogenase family protein subunit M n=1 Tax=Vallicoccus soli TaxID=2339232 RepID=A0A3A3ZLI8_9ACTN|nr:xanthine dehydrogenase family protein subunit M [Vallicoccus soli]RJK97096.1 xanthine dehydrogenase family protein subunit M [Vallicoccus soli]